MDCKLKINLNEGTLEVEGSEALVKEIYRDFKENLKFEKVAPSSTKTKTVAIESQNSAPIKKATKPKTSKTSKPVSSAKLLTALNLRPSGKTGLKDYIVQFKKPSNEEKILIFIYYLKEELQEANIGLDHIYTCFKETNNKVPAHLKQVVTNVKNSKGWLDNSNWEDLNFTVQGMNHIEHDIEK